MFSETIEVSVTYGTKLTFFLRMIGISEENQLRQKAFGLSDDEKAEKEYQNNVDILAELSEKMPVGLFPNKPEELPPGTAESGIIYIEKFKTPRLAIEKFFAEKSVVKERIAFYAVRSYFLRLQPEESFFSL